MDKFCRYLLTLSFIITTTICFADLPICGIPTKGVQEIYENGGLMLLSRKNNSSVLMYNTSKIRGNCNFFIEITNHQPQMETFYIHNLVVTDQHGRRLPIRSHSDVIRTTESQANVRQFFQEAGNFFETVDTSANAGRVQYCERTDYSRDVHVDKWSRHGSASHTRFSEDSSSITRGEIHDERARRVALNSLADRQAYERAALNQYNTEEICKAENYYLNTHTLMPNETFGRNFQVIIPKEIQKNLEYLYFYCEYAGETHNFCYAVRPQSHCYCR